MQLPNRARLEEGLRQVRQSHADSQLALQVRSKEMRRWGDLLVIRDVSPRRSEDTRDAVLVWEGADTLAHPGWNGSLERPRTGPISPTGPLRSVEAGAENVFSAFAGTSDACGLFFITSVECETYLTSEVWQSG